MTPNFSEEIKKLLDKKPLTFSEMETLKKELISYATDYTNLKNGGNSSINLTNTFTNDIKIADANDNFIIDIGRRMERTGDYKMIENKRVDDTYEILICPLDRKWWEKYNPLQTYGGVLLGAVLTFIGTAINNREKKQTPLPTIKVEDTRIQPLYDSLSIIRKDLKSFEDSLTKHK